jgi:putative transposase
VSKVSGHRISTSGMMKFLGVSRSGYRAFLNRKVSAARQRKETIKKQIHTIYDNFKRNYGAPKITKKLRESGVTIAERTVGKYMREMSIKAQWIKPWTTTTRDSDFSNELHNTSLMSSLIQNVLTLSGALILLTFGLRMVLFALTALWTYLPRKS